MKRNMFVLIITLLFGMALGLVLGKSSNLVILNGPGLAEDTQLDDPIFTHFLSLTLLEDVENPIEEPSELGHAYTLDRWFLDEDGRGGHFDTATYYTHPDGGLGYVYYDGIHNGWSEYDEQWYQVNPISEAVMRQVIAGNKIPYYAVMSGTTVYLIDPDDWTNVITVEADSILRDFDWGWE